MLCFGHVFRFFFPRRYILDLHGVHYVHTALRLLCVVIRHWYPLSLQTISFGSAQPVMKPHQSDTGHSALTIETTKMHSTLHKTGYRAKMYHAHYKRLTYANHLTFFSASSIFFLHPDAFLLNVKIPKNPIIMQTPAITVSTGPTPIAVIQGSATMVPTQLRILRIKLLTATPAELFLRINSVSIVVAAACVTVSTVKSDLCISQETYKYEHRRDTKYKCSYRWRKPEYAIMQSPTEYQQAYWVHGIGYPHVLPHSVFR